MAYRFRDGFTLPWNGKFNGHIVSHSDRFSIPLRRRKPTVFAVWNDLFHDDVPSDFIKRAYGVMFDRHDHTYLVLTKRPQIMKTFFDQHFMDSGNIWHGLTVCNQEEADAKIPVFLQVPGKKFLSIEPMLGPIDISKRGMGLQCESCVDRRVHWCVDGVIDAVILGGETGPGARPMHPDWVRSVRDQCAAAGVPFFFKSWGAWRGAAYFDKENNMVPGSHMIGRLLDGRTHDDLPWVKP